jgi:O-acetyl-ADP-ribose deacetylase (regulator of RNase III)
MIKFQQGDILQAEAEALVNTVNCVGVMGRGIALQFKKAYPNNFKKYKAACENKKVIPGRMFIHNTDRCIMPRYIINFPTKRNWKNKSRIEDIESGLKALVKEVRELGISSIAIPPLGCGLGGLDWNIVCSMIEKAFEELPGVLVFLYKPVGAPSPENMVKSKNQPSMTKGRAALLCLMTRYLEAAMDPFVTLLEIHKLMYFTQEAGETLRLSYTKAKYGPYAENLRHVLTRIEGHFIIGYADGGDNPEKSIELMPGVSKKANEFLKTHPETTAHIEHVGELIEGFETPYGMELLSTVHWVMVRENAGTLEEVIDKTYIWNKRKNMFREKHIQIAMNTLMEQNWIKKGNS